MITARGRVALGAGAAAGFGNGSFDLGNGPLLSAGAADIALAKYAR